MGTYLRVLNESYPMNTKLTGFIGFQESLHEGTVASGLEGLRTIAIMYFFA